jgi:single-stranded-DNA-specific exonuclease
MGIFEEILKKRGLGAEEERTVFLNPSYNEKHNPFLLPDMDKAVKRLVLAHSRQESIMIYGDYDIDGLTATAILLDAFSSFGFSRVNAFIPNRFVEGYGLTIDAVERIAKTGATLIVTVDCGSLSEKEVVRANELGIDVIVTDHHNVALNQPPAIAVINPKRLLQDFPDDYEELLLKRDSRRKDVLYPFLDLAGCGVAFKLVQALQTQLDGLGEGQEKWLLDLVALGTVCDVVTLVDENRANVFWGLKVLAKTRRPGLKALMAISKVEPDSLNTRSLGFGLGPRMNAAGRLETAQIALDMLTADDSETAFEKAQQLDALNLARRSDQDKIYKEATIQAKKMANDDVLVVSDSEWNHGIVGIVAAKLLEKYKKPVFVLQEMGEESKGSARSYGDFSAVDAIRASDDIITKGGGHRLAAGVTLPTENIHAFRVRVNEFYKQQKLHLDEQRKKLVPMIDAHADIDCVSEELIEQIALLEPFGSGNPQPILYSNHLTVLHVRKMGTEGQHVKIDTQCSSGGRMQFHAFNAPSYFFPEIGSVIDVWYQPDVNEWQGRKTIEGRLQHLQLSEAEL